MLKNKESLIKFYSDKGFPNITKKNMEMETQRFQTKKSGTGIYWLKIS